MVNFDDSTPQLKLIKRMCEGYISLDLNNVEPTLSKNYHYEAFPESAELPKQTKESHLRVWGEVFSLLNKLEVRTNPTSENRLRARRLISTTPS
jgi:hypothetical protein